MRRLKQHQAAAQRGARAPQRAPLEKRLRERWKRPGQCYPRGVLRGKRSPLTQHDLRCRWHGRWSSWRRGFRWRKFPRERRARCELARRASQPEGTRRSAPLHSALQPFRSRRRRASGELFPPSGECCAMTLVNPGGMQAGRADCRIVRTCFMACLTARRARRWPLPGAFFSRSRDSEDHQAEQHAANRVVMAPAEERTGCTAARTEPRRAANKPAACRRCTVFGHFFRRSKNRLLVTLAWRGPSGYF